MGNEALSVISVKTGIQFCGSDAWRHPMGSRLRGNDNHSVIPVKTGIHTACEICRYAYIFARPR